MGTVAAMLKERGYRITGSDDHLYPPMSTFLEEEGIEVMEGFSAGHLHRAPDLVVIGNAVSRGNPEVEETLNRRIPYLSMPEVVRDFFLRKKRSVVIAGTHGKTTTTALSAHLLSSAGLDPSFLIGGMARNFCRSYKLGKGTFFIVEGDEYDSAFFAKTAKFFFYLPEVLVVNNIEFDHADIYANLSEIEKAFRQLINLVPQNGLILANGDDPVVTALVAASFAPVQTFGFGNGAFWKAGRIEVAGEMVRFTVSRQGERWEDFELRMSGAHNVRNALAAIGVGVQAGLSADQLRNGLRTFKGVLRRQQIVGEVDRIVLIDDFAHHPTAVAHTLEGVRMSYPGARVWAVFEPASATNARATFTDRYVDAFAAADSFIIAKVPRPDRASLDVPMDPHRLAALIRERGRTARYIPEVHQIIDRLLGALRPGDVVVFMSNAGFGNVQSKLLEALRERHDAQTFAQTTGPRAR